MKRILIILLSTAMTLMAYAGDFRHGMRRLPDTCKYTIADNDARTVAESPSKLGWYISSVGVVETPDGIVTAYRRSDFHTAVTTDIMVAYSNDAGRTWEGHRSIAHADVWNEEACWVAPQLSRLSDGRLVIIADLGNRTSGQDWPMLSTWQQPGRGMQNYLFWSEDDGRSWSEPVQVDNVGGEPSYITETDSGILLYTRTESKKTDVLWNPPPPWNDIYYFNSAVLSHDGGRTWDTVVALADDPHHGDCEVGTVDLGDGRLMALTRIGFGGGQYRNPSRIAYSHDDGHTWTGHRLSPFYAQRPILRRLDSGKILLHYRNRWGTPANYAVLLDPDEALSYEPALYVYDEDRCRLKDGILTFRTDEGVLNLVTYGFYPAHNPESRVLVEADLKLDKADIHACNIAAGCWVRIEPDRICLADHPETGFSMDTTAWHQYRFFRDGTVLKIYVDGKKKLETDVSKYLVRDVVIGNRQVKQFNWNHIGDEEDDGWGTTGVSHWKSLRVSVENPHDYDIDWSWDPAKGYPDQFRRDRMIALDVIASSPGHIGYGGSAQLEDGSIVIVDYTVGGNGGTPARMPFARAYLLTEEMFETASGADSGSR